MKEILEKAYSVKAELELHAVETDPSLEFHIQSVVMLLILGYDYMKSNPLDVHIDVNLDPIAELAKLFDMVENFTPINPEEEKFVILASELLLQHER